MYELIDKIENDEIRLIMHAFYNDLKYFKIFKDEIDFKNTPFNNSNYDLEKVVKFIIKNQKSSWHH